MREGVGWFKGGYAVDLPAAKLTSWGSGGFSTTKQQRSVAAASCVESRIFELGERSGVPGSSPTLVTMPPSVIRANHCTLVAQRRRGKSKTRVSATSNAERNDVAYQIMRAPSAADTANTEDAGEFPTPHTYAAGSAEGCARCASAPTALAQRSEQKTKRACEQPFVSFPKSASNISRCMNF
jgi:hypothetical protein